MKPKQTGSILLLLISIVSITSMTLITALLAVKNLKRTVNLSVQQHYSRQILDQQVRARLDALSKGFNPSVQNNDETMSVVNRGIQFNVSLRAIQPLIELNQASAGFSLNSLYTTQIIRVDTQVNNTAVQSPLNSSTMKCLKLNNGELKANVETSYSLHPHGDAGQQLIYDFNPDTGEIWRHSNTSELLIDVDLMPDQSFARPAFMLVNQNGNTKIAIIFMTRQPALTSTSTDKLYILFDEFVINSTRPLTIDATELTELNNDLILSDADRGYWLDLNRVINHGMMTVFANQVLLIAQSLDSASAQQSHYSNTFFQINLNKNASARIQINPLTSSDHKLGLFAHTDDQQSIIFHTQKFEPLITLESQCITTSTHES